MQVADFQDRRGNLLRDSIRYHWYLILFGAMLGAALGIALVFLRPATFSSSTTLILNPLSGNPYSPASDADTLEMLQTEAVAATSEVSAEAVISELHLDISKDQLQRQTKVTVPPNTQALDISYTSTNSSLAVKVVNAIAQQFLLERERLATESISRTTSALDSQIRDARAQYDDARKAGAKSLAAGYQANLIDLQTQRAAANALPTDPGRVLTPGLPPEESGSRHLLTFVLAGLLAGAVAGLALALWRERRLDVVRSADDLADYDFAAPVSVMRGRQVGGAALRQLRMRLAQQVSGHGVVGLVGVAPRTALPVAVMVARSLAEAGTTVTLIDGTGTEAGHADPLGYADKPGFADALAHPEQELPSGHHISDRMTYLPAGSDPTASVEHLVTSRARKIIRTLATRSDVTVLACVATDQVEGEALARLTDGVVVLVRLHRTSHFDLGVVLRSISTLELPLLGVFVVPAATT